jgi:alanyl-tRNA synthetase
LEYFRDRQHIVVPSASLIADDPNLLFVNAGMVPFKPYLLGEQKAPYARATSVQKVIRTLDIDEVGKTSRHGSFFQMNGNFSFGDYFKREAVEFAWELVTRPQSNGGYGLDPAKLWATVFHDDNETFELWRNVVGVPESRIVRRGMKDNYWSMGVPGPCGPCSEIFFDRGAAYGPDGGPEVDEDRFMEIWNLVFMQYVRGEGGAKEDYPILGELPAKNIDTGMGLERIGSILQGVDNLYEIDEVRPVLTAAAELSGRRYGADADADVRLRVVADHVRTSLMLIADGVTPGNDGRNYVLRRILRRAVRAMRLLGVDAPTLPELLPVSRTAMASSYPEIERDFARISEVAYAEEESFRHTHRAGTSILDTAVRKAKADGRSVLAGDQVFALHDTYGFPIDLTLEMAAEQGVSVDEQGFRRLMAQQKARAQADSRAKRVAHSDVSAYRSILDDMGRPVDFAGYDEVTSEGVVRGLLVDGALAESAVIGDDLELVLDRTPFYAEGGGQLADQGRIVLDNGAIVEIHDVQSPATGVIIHRGTVREGEVVVGTAAQSFVDVARRMAISRAHTATHMVHKAFREALGETATQAGSENSPGRFRFDFSATGVIPSSAVQDVEQRVNEVLAENLPVRAEIMSQADAVASGAMALFGKRYGDAVRVVSVGDWARELCGGTHAGRSGELGLVKLLGVSSIGAGVRRVEALVGVDAYRFLAREHVLVTQLAEALKVRPDDLVERVSTMVTQLRDTEKEIDRIRTSQLLEIAPSLAATALDLAGVSYVGHRAPDDTSGDDLRKLVLDVRGRLPIERAGVVVGTAVRNDRPIVVVAVNEKARERNVKAGRLVSLAAKVLGGGGGGKDDVAQGGGANPAMVDEALRLVAGAIQQ